MPADRMQELLDAMAERLQRSVVLDDPDIRPLATSRHFGDEDGVRIRAVLQHDPGAAAIGHVLAQGVRGWTRAGYIPESPELGMKARWCVPVRWHGDLVGLVMVMDARRDLSAEHAGWLVALADELAVVLVTARSRNPERDDAHVAAAVDADLMVSRRALAELVGRGRLTAETILVAVAVRAASNADARWDGSAAPSPAHLAGVLRHALHHWHAGPGLGKLCGLREGVGVGLILVSGRPPEPTRMRDLAAQLAAGVCDVGAGAVTGVVGVGLAASAVDAWRSFRQARIAARCVPRLRPGPVVEFATLGLENVLARIPDEEWDRTLIPPALHALAAVDRDGRLQQTLEAFLVAGGAGQDTADALHVHRTLLHYRLDRIRAITGVDLDEGRVRAALMVGLTVQHVLDGPVTPGRELADFDT